MMKTGNGLVVAVSGMIANDSPAPGIAVLRSLQANPKFSGRLIGLSYDAMEAGNFIEGLASDVFLLPYPSQGLEDYRNRLLYIKERQGLDVFLPTLDAEMLPVIRMSAELKAQGISTFLPTEEQFKLRAKNLLFETASHHGLPVPRSFAVSDLPSLLAVARILSYPIVVKGIFYEAYIAHTPQEASAHFAKLAAKWGLPIVVQEFLSGDEYDVAAVGDGAGGIIGAVPMRKLQLSDKGKAWAGVTIRDNDLLDLTYKTIHALKWRGALELEVMKSGGRYFILEINPRFPAWIYLAQAAGQNLPYACLELALGRKIKPLKSCRSGIVFIRAAMDHVIPLSHLESMTTTGERVRSEP